MRSEGESEDVRMGGRKGGGVRGKERRRRGKERGVRRKERGRGERGWGGKENGG